MTLTVPSRNGLSDLLEMLCGDDYGISDPVAIADLTGSYEGGYATEILSDDDRVLGLMMADLPGTIAFGAKLMMMGPGAIEDQMDAKEAEPDTILAMAEIFNNLTTPFNDVDGNDHIRVMSIKKIEEFDLAGDWTGDDVQAVEFVGKVQGSDLRLGFLTR